MYQLSVVVDYVWKALPPAKLIRNCHPLYHIRRISSEPIKQRQQSEEWRTNLEQLEQNGFRLEKLLSEKDMPDSESYLEPFCTPQSTLSTQNAEWADKVNNFCHKVIYTEQEETVAGFHFLSLKTIPCLFVVSSARISSETKIIWTGNIDKVSNIIQ